jgi:hypothetical protein
MIPLIITCASDVVAMAFSAFDELLGCMSKKLLHETVIRPITAIAIILNIFVFIMYSYFE